MKKLNIKMDLENKQVNDMSFDWFGRRIALILDFKEIAIFRIPEQEESYQSEFEANFEYGILKVKWCHPHHGIMLAASTCIKSVIIILKENCIIKKSSNKFVFKEFHDLRENVMDLKFLPKDYGRTLSIGFFDGSVGIYRIEGVIKGNLTMTLILLTQIGNNPVTCLSWSKDDRHPLMFAAGHSIKVEKFIKCEINMFYDII
jgi:hypothetical protein